jgi:hypothetical protein
MYTPYSYIAANSTVAILIGVQIQGDLAGSQADLASPLIISSDWFIL